MIIMAVHMNCLFHLVLTVVFTLLCFSSCTGQNCLLPNHDMANLTSGIWTFNSSGANCLKDNGTLTNDCRFEIRFCAALGKTQVCGDNSTVCETDAENDKEYNIAGKGNPFFVDYKDSSQGFKSNLGLGGSYNINPSTQCRINTTINFNCNSAKPWPMILDGKETQTPDAPVIQLVYSSGICLYNITFEFAGACLMIQPAIPSNRPLSAGSVLTIMFFVFLLTYFVFGTMYNIGCRGARGKEVIPNIDFWTMLPVYVADGFIFTFRCGGPETSSYDSI